MTDNKQVVLSFEGVTVRLGNGIKIKDASLKVNGGELIGICGCKTEKDLLIKLLLGMKKPSSGKIFYWGREMKEGIIPNHRKVGVFLDGMSFYPYMSGYRNLEAVLYSKGDHSKENIKKAVDMVGLGGIISKKVKRYSKKETYLLGVAAALVNEPELIILDSPSKYLDEDGMGLFISVMEDMTSSQGCAVIVAEDNMAKLLYCNKAVRIDEGRLSGFYSPKDIKEEYSKEKCFCRIETDDRMGAVKVIERAVDVLYVGEYEKGSVLVELLKDGANDKLQKIIKALVFSGIAVYTVMPISVPSFDE